MYVPVLSLLIENDKKLLEQLKSGFKGTVKWNKYRSQMSVNPTFTKLNRLFVLSFERIEENNVEKYHRDSFSRYYVKTLK